MVVQSTHSTNPHNTYAGCEIVLQYAIDDLKQAWANLREFA